MLQPQDHPVDCMNAVSIGSADVFVACIFYVSPSSHLVLVFGLMAFLEVSAWSFLELRVNLMFHVDAFTRLIFVLNCFVFALLY